MSVFAFRRFFTFLLLGISACTNPVDIPKEAALTVLFPVSVRETPREDTPVVQQLQEGQTVQDLYKVSPFISSIYLGDTLRQDPWIYIRTQNGREGWVFAGAVRPVDPDQATRRDWLLAKRLEGWFGSETSAKWKHWRASFLQADSDTAMARVVFNGYQLQDTVNQQLARYVTQNPGRIPLDLYWLAEAMPGFIVQRVGAYETFQLFTDYRVLSGQAVETAGRQDDLYLEVCLTAFPADSIESALPAWVFPVSPEKSYSNLGSGKHLEVLSAIDTALLSGQAFEEALTRMKDQVLGDILNNDRKYWQGKAKILAELDAILAARLHCLSNRDRLALEAKRKMFEAPDENNLTINLRTGE